MNPQCREMVGSMQEGNEFWETPARSPKRPVSEPLTSAGPRITTPHPHLRPLQALDLLAKGLKQHGPQNNLMRHVATGLPADLFATTEANWWNYLVCRTGPVVSNLWIALEAKARGWHWNPY
jgi:hypothetical protein